MNNEQKIKSVVENGKFNIATYESFVSTIGLKKLWNYFIQYLLNKGIDSFSKNIIDFYDIGRLYEIGLAVENKNIKKQAGKYFTPNDISQLMAELLIENQHVTSIADVGCGCGNLIIDVLDKIKKRSPEEFENLSGQIYLYDIDKTALKICVARINVLFGIPSDKIHIIHGDFLSKKTKLPLNCYVISNPPYSKVLEIKQDWEFKESITQSKDLYIGFIEKIIKKAKKAVIISPQSYIVGNNFSSIRNVLNEFGSGEIYSFDNVPGTIFNGKKAGVFNTNTSNGVRASILTFNRTKEKGYRLTHLIRFKSEQRQDIVNISYLKNQLGNHVQNLIQPLKCFKELEDFVYSLKSEETISSLLETNGDQHNECFRINVNSSARYFIIGSVKKLNRGGTFSLYAKDEQSFYKLYALLNSSYAYLWWRMMDGGILLPKSLILRIPLPEQLDLNAKIISLCKEMIKEENCFLVYKKNAGALQESIKFPVSYREILNKELFGNYPFELVHSNKEIY